MTEFYLGKVGNDMLGYPIPSFPEALWSITVLVNGRALPIAYERAQALEIARRIISHYGIENVWKPITPPKLKRQKLTLQRKPYTFHKKRKIKHAKK